MSAVESNEGQGPEGGLQQRVRSLRLPDASDGGGFGTPLAWALCIMFAASTAVLGVMAFRRPAAEQAAAATPAGSAAPANDAPVASSGGIVLESKGYLTPAHQITVSPKVSGMVMQMRIEEGQRVEKGQVLAEIEDTDYRAEYDRVRGLRDAAWQRLLELYRGARPEELTQARAELAEVEAQLPQLKAEVDRNRGLRERNVLPLQDYELSESKYLAMVRRQERLRSAVRLMEEGPRQERIDAARAEVRQAEADVGRARWRLENCTIRAPISGTILKKNTEEGNIVNPIAFNISASVCDVANLSDLEVDLSIQERDISRIFADQACKIVAEAWPKREYTGYVSRLMPIADRAKGAVSVRVKVAVPRKEEGFYLKPQMQANVSFYDRSVSKDKK